MTKLILARHGNTFEKGDICTWVGAKTDLPLTQTGEEQAQALANVIYMEYAPLGGILTGPLLRTKRAAEIIAKQVNNVFVIDERLIEIDYGLWENKSSEEIRENAEHAELLEAWEAQGAFPQNMHWAPSEEKLKQNVDRFLAEQHKILMGLNARNRVAVTSNGILRFTYQHLTGNIPGPDAKVKTGHYCILEVIQDGWKILEWNKKP